MTLPKELRDKAVDQAKHEDSDGYFGFISGAEWLYGELMPKLKELKEANKRISELEDQVLDLDRFDL